MINPLSNGALKLGFGAMRLPERDGEIDLPRFCGMVDSFLAAGGRYFDTAYPYHDGKSERALKDALVSRYPREGFLLADKMPLWLLNEPSDLEKTFQTQLERTGAGYFDFYLLHAISEKRMETVDQTGAFDYLCRLRERGLIRRLGFSFHDTAEVLDKVLTDHPETEFVQLQLNYFDWENDKVQSRLCYETAVRHGKPVVVMEPVRGGSLALLPDALRAPLLTSAPERSVASWALRFAASMENVMVVLSGMSDIEQMRDNLSTFSPLAPLSAEENTLLLQTGEALRAIQTVPCTGCGYCKEVCPMEINIPGALSALNALTRFANLEKAKGAYRNATAKGGKAGDCIACGACADRCPQSIDIPAHMAEAAGKLED